MTNALRLGIAGLGTVGTGLLNIVAKHSAALTVRGGTPIEVSEVTARDRGKDRGIDLTGYTWAASPEVMASSENVDVFVELMGGDGEPAKSSVEAALRSGKHVVTANKALLAMHGNELAKLAEDNNVALNFEAAVAGGIPIVKTIRESATANQISRVYGIMNGTCNFIMTKMRNEARDFAEVLAEAQELGYAEADPTFDIGGFDAAHKLAILTSLAFGREIDFSAIYVEGIEHIQLRDITVPQGKEPHPARGLIAHGLLAENAGQDDFPPGGGRSRRRDHLLRGDRDPDRDAPVERGRVRDRGRPYGPRSAGVGAARDGRRGMHPPGSWIGLPG